jgi:uncharacterized membrane protein YeiB
MLLFSQYTLGMGYRFDSAFITSLVLALIVWIATLFGAALCQRYSYRGPAEILLRRLAYGSQYRKRAVELEVAETV